MHLRLPRARSKTETTRLSSNRASSRYVRYCELPSAGPMNQVVGRLQSKSLEPQPINRCLRP